MAKSAATKPALKRPNAQADWLKNEVAYNNAIAGMNRLRLAFTAAITAKNDLTNNVIDSLRSSPNYEASEGR